MKNHDNDLMEWLDATPDTKRLVRDLENIDIPDLTKDPEFQAGIQSAESDCSTLTRCEICKEDCGTMAGLIVHVRKFHPSSDKESTEKEMT